MGKINENKGGIPLLFLSELVEIYRKGIPPLFSLILPIHGTHGPFPTRYNMQEVRGGITFHKFPMHDKEWYRPVGRPLKTTDYGLVRPNIQHSNFWQRFHLTPKTVQYWVIFYCVFNRNIALFRFFVSVVKENMKNTKYKCVIQRINCELKTFCFFCFIKLCFKTKKPCFKTLF